MIKDHFPFHNGFINTRGLLKTLTENSFVSFNLCIVSDFNNNTTTPVNEEAPLDDINQKGTEETIVQIEYLQDAY